MSQDKNPKHDVRTSAGGRGYVADYFVNVLKRHDFTRYINEALAADFACALAAHLERTGQSVTNDAQWQGIGSLRASDDLVWLYDQDSNTIDGPVPGADHYVDSWTHWAWANAPSTATIDGATPPEAATAEAAGKAPASVPSSNEEQI